MRDHCESILRQAVDSISEQLAAQIASEFAEALYADLEDIFETARSTNEDMRRAADRQLDDLNDELADARNALDEAEDLVSKLRDAITSLESQIPE